MAERVATAITSVNSETAICVLKLYDNSAFMVSGSGSERPQQVPIIMMGGLWWQIRLGWKISPTCRCSYSSWRVGLILSGAMLQQGGNHSSTVVKKMYGIFQSGGCNKYIIQHSTQGGAINRLLKCFFSMYKTSSLIKAYGRLKSTGWCVLGCWLCIYSMNASFFAISASGWLQNEWQVFRMYSAASRTYYVNYGLT
jgi:hypothetical protein